MDLAAAQLSDEHPRTRVRRQVVRLEHRPAQSAQRRLRVRQSHHQRRHLARRIKQACDRAIAAIRRLHFDCIDSQRHAVEREPSVTIRKKPAPQFT